MQRRIQNPYQTSKMERFKKIVLASKFYMYGRVLNTAVQVC